MRCFGVLNPCWMTEDFRLSLLFEPWLFKSEILPQHSWWRGKHLTEGSMWTPHTMPPWMNLHCMMRPSSTTDLSGPLWSVLLVMTLWIGSPTLTSIETKAVWVVTGLCDHLCRSFMTSFRRWVHTGLPKTFLHFLFSSSLLSFPDMPTMFVLHWALC